MLTEIKNPAGKKICFINPKEKAFEIISDGYKTTVVFAAGKSTYEIEHVRLKDP